MNFIQLQELLLKFGIKTNISRDGTSIDTKYDKYQDYEILIRNKENFEYGVMHQERQPVPYFGCEKKFTNINEATKYVFIDILSSEYKVGKLLGTEFRKTLSIDVYKKQFDVEEFKKLMIENNISTDLLNYCNAFIDKYGGIVKFYELYFQEDILFHIYKEIFALNFFEKEVIPKLKEMNIYNEFTEEDIYRFVF